MSVHLPSSHGADLGFAVRVYNPYLITALQFGYGPVRNQERVRNRADLGASGRILSGPQGQFRIWKGDSNLNSPCLRIDLAINKSELALMRINTPIRQNEFHFF